jgi:hypothetical protein
MGNEMKAEQSLERVELPVMMNVQDRAQGNDIYGKELRRYG